MTFHAIVENRIWSGRCWGSVGTHGILTIARSGRASLLSNSYEAGRTSSHRFWEAPVLGTEAEKAGGWAS